MGSIIADNNTGAQSVMVTVIPITGDSNKFYPATNLVVAQSTDLDKCNLGSTSGVSTTFYKDTLYIICVVRETKENGGILHVDTYRPIY